MPLCKITLGVFDDDMDKDSQVSPNWSFLAVTSSLSCKKLGKLVFGDNKMTLIIINEPDVIFHAA